MKGPIASLLLLGLVASAAAAGGGGKLEIMAPYCKEAAPNKAIAAYHNSAAFKQCATNKASCDTCEKHGGTTLQGTVEHSEALFGVPQYAGKLTGTVFYGTPGNKNACLPYTSTPWEKQVEGGDPVIILVDRGNCTFVQKVRNAQSKSGNAVIIVDNVNEAQLPVMADDGTGSDIVVPAVFISKAEGQKIKDTIASGLRVQAELSWSLPTPDNRVEWSFWTSSNDDESISFIKNFKEADISLGKNAQLTPHYLVIDGHTFGCVTGDDTLPCGKQCSHNGRYCAEDPEHDFKVGLDGEDVVLENLRQICIFKTTNSTGEQHKWWDYVQFFDTNCEADEDYNEACSQRQQDLAKLTATQKQQVMQCVNQAESATQCQTDDVQCLRTTDVANPLLEAELKARRDDGVFILPTIMINTQKYRGRLTCPHPISQTTCGVLQAICAGYLDPSKVPACTDEYCWQSLDHCGECRDSPSDPEWDTTCCDHTRGKRIDACGICGGSGSYDKCGKCRQADDPRRDDCNIYDNQGKVIGETIDGLNVNGHIDDKGEFVEAPAVAPAAGGGGDVTSVVIFFCIVIAVVVIGAFFYIKQRDEANRRHVESVVASYMPLPGDGASRRANNNEADTASLTIGQGSAAM